MAFRTTRFGLILMSLLALGMAYYKAEQPVAPKVSTFAPADDIVSQISFFVERAEKGVAEKSDFDDGVQNKLKKDAATISVLAQALGLHDSDHKLKAAAPAIVVAAQGLAASAEDYDKAKQAVENLKKAVAGEGKADLKLSWNEKVAPLGPLMHQVPLINNPLKKSIKDNKTTGAPNAATLAVIAQASMADTSAVKNPTDLAKWYELCAMMRDGAALANKGIHSSNKTDITDGMQKLSQSCEDCHAVFRKEGSK